MNSEIGSIEVTCPLCPETVVIPVMASSGQVRRQIILTVDQYMLRTHLLSHDGDERPLMGRRARTVTRLEAVVDIAAEMSLEAENRDDDDASMKWIAVHRKARQALGLLHGVKDE